MKKIVSTVVSLLVFALLITACKPDQVSPKSAPETAAFAKGVPVTDTTHWVPLPGCHNEVGQLVMKVNGSIYPLSGTHFVIVNDESNLFLEIKAPNGWEFDACGLEVLSVGEGLLVGPQGNIDFGGFDYFERVANGTTMHMWHLDGVDLDPSMLYCVAARLVNQANPNQAYWVWLDGVDLPNGAGIGYEYGLSMDNCPGSLPWWQDS